MARQITRVDQLPAMVRRTIHFLPTYFTTEPISEKEMMETNNGTVGEVINGIKKNISLISNPQVAKKVEEELETQIAIICHGYEGVCPNDQAANQIAKQIRLTYSDLFK